GRFTPQGNIGKYSDLAIESWLEWDGEEGKLIDVLIKSGWLDVDDTHRLIVHDWHQHADRATRQTLKRSKLPFFVPDGSVSTHREHRDTESDHMSSTQVTLPVPVPVPEPEPVPVPEAKATPRKRVAVKAEFVLPQWIPSEAWSSFVEMRKKIRAPLTAAACVSTVQDLEKLAKRGHDPGLVLMQSVQRCWRGVFELKGDSNGTSANGGARSHFQTRTERNLEALRNSLEGCDQENAGGSGGTEAGVSKRGDPEELFGSPVILPPERTAPGIQPDFAKAAR